LLGGDAVGSKKKVTVPALPPEEEHDLAYDGAARDGLPSRPPTADFRGPRSTVEVPPKRSGKHR
jgi:hypothetical protein